MAGWEEELAVLLRNLGVIEEPPSHPQPMYSQVKNDATKWERQEMSTDIMPWDEALDLSEDEVIEASVTSEDIEEEAWLADLSTMKREVETIVAQVIRLIQRGDLDQPLKEDIMVVLRALQKRSGSQLASGDELYLESAAEMLHFCRLVLRLSETAIEDNQG